MTRFLVRRLFWGLLVIWFVATSVFAMFFAAPRDVARLIADDRQANKRSNSYGIVWASINRCPSNICGSLAGWRMAIWGSRF